MEQSGIEGTRIFTKKFYAASMEQSRIEGTYKIVLMQQKLYKIYNVMGGKKKKKTYRRSINRSNGTWNSDTGGSLC